MKSKKKLSYLGNIFILLSLLGFAYIFYPIVFIYLFPPQIKSQEIIGNGFTISIPKIHAYADVIPNVNPWNKTEYLAALRHGIAHAKGTSLPGEKGMTYLFAHSSGAPWEMNKYNTIFFRLGELKKGDIITIDYQKKRYKYTVTEKKEIWPNETKYLKDTKINQLILQTCTPIGTSLKRLLIFAIRE